MAAGRHHGEAGGRGHSASGGEGMPRDRKAIASVEWMAGAGALRKSGAGGRRCGAGPLQAQRQRQTRARVRSELQNLRGRARGRGRRGRGQRQAQEGARRSSRAWTRPPPLARACRAGIHHRRVTQRGSSELLPSGGAHAPSATLCRLCCRRQCLLYTAASASAAQEPSAI
ncbi:MAG: hypothetical protein J3K34DRAFT_423989 [Monoraphidium minutum]|nr:MAG: hypothetical protein J3K34DRAFT_423989 [Monoraphidium minutum]